MGAKARPIDAMPWNGSVDIDIRSTAFSNALLWNWIAIENIQPWDLRKTFMSEMKTKTVSNESTFPKRRWNLSTLVDLRCSLHLAEAPNLFLKGQRQSLLVTTHTQIFPQSLFSGTTECVDGKDEKTETEGR